MNDRLVALVHDRRIGSSTLSNVLAYGASKAASGGEAFVVPVTHIAADLEYSRVTIIKTLRALCAAGLLTVEGEVLYFGSFVTRYRINVPALEALPQTKTETQIMLKKGFLS